MHAGRGLEEVIVIDHTTTVSNALGHVCVGGVLQLCVASVLQRARVKLRGLFRAWSREVYRLYSSIMAAHSLFTSNTDGVGENTSRRKLNLCCLLPAAAVCCQVERWPQDSRSSVAAE